MTRTVKIAQFALALSLVCGAPATAAQQEARQTAEQARPFGAWLEEVKREAAAQGISAGTIERALNLQQPAARVVELDRRQPEFSLTFWDYLSRTVSEARVTQGRRLLAQHRRLLQRTAARYGVQPRFLVAFWGLESNFGENMGGFPVVQSVASLAYDGRREELFRAELFAALRIIDQGHITPGRMLGSWAGAMGQPQFLPTTFLQHAVDDDGDGRRDIWGTLDDVFGSAANYLRAIGWKGAERWGREVRLPAGFDLNQSGLDSRLTAGQWRAKGVTKADGTALPGQTIRGAIVLPAGHKGPAFLVYDNFDVIMRWNRSIFYALTIGHLSDRIAGGPPLVAKRPADDRPMARREIEELQRILAALGHDVGEADGVVGAQTRAALREYQRSVGLPADGYPTPLVLQRLRRSRDG